VTRTCLDPSLDSLRQPRP